MSAHFVALFVLFDILALSLYILSNIVITSRGKWELSLVGYVLWTVTKETF